MPLIIPDEALEAAGLSEQDARVEIACRLFEAGRLSSGAAARLAELDRSGFETALLDREIPLVRPTVDDFDSDMQAMKKLGL